MVRAGNFTRNCNTGRATAVPLLLPPAEERGTGADVKFSRPLSAVVRSLYSGVSKFTVTVKTVTA